MWGNAAVRHDLETGLLEAGRLKEVVDAYREALAVDPDRAATWHKGSHGNNRFVSMVAIVLGQAAK